MSRKHLSQRGFQRPNVGALDLRGDIEVVDRRVLTELLLDVHTSLKGSQRIEQRLFLLVGVHGAGCLFQQLLFDAARCFALEDIGDGNEIQRALPRGHSRLDRVAAE